MTNDLTFPSYLPPKAKFAYVKIAEWIIKPGREVKAFTLVTKKGPEGKEEYYIKVEYPDKYYITNAIEAAASHTIVFLENNLYVKLQLISHRRKKFTEGDITKIDVIVRPVEDRDTSVLFDSPFKRQ